MIELINVTKEFKSGKKYEGFSGAIKSLFTNEFTIKKAVDDISLHISTGESVGYIGVNGAGKSTSIKMMAGVLTPTKGICRVNGIIPYENRKENAKNIGVVFGQRSQLWWDLPLSESMNILRNIYNIPKEIFTRRLGYISELLDLKEFYLTPVRNLSLGQRMRGDFAASLLHEPKILYLDEPTIGLDLFVKENIRKIIKTINAELKTTILLTTHDLFDIEEICQRIIVIDNGKLIFDGSLSALKKHYNQFKKIVFKLKTGNTTNHMLLNNDLDCTATQAGDILTVTFKVESVEIADIISYIASKYEFQDLNVIENGLEDIVREIYLTRSKN